jgi:hypothetical protein
MDLDEIFNQLKDIDEYEKYAGIGLSPQKIAKIYKIHEPKFMAEFDTPGSKLSFHHERGRLLYEALDMKSMLECAIAGNTTQGQRLDKYRKERDLELIRRRIFYGEE